MMRSTGLALLLAFAWLMSAQAPALAQTTNSSTGGVDSATSRNGYPAGGGTVSLPTVQNSSASTTGTSTTTTGTTTTTTGTTTGTSGGAAGSTSSGASGTGAGGSAGGTVGAGGGRGGGAATTGSAASSRSSGTQSGGHWVLCPPGGSGLAPLFTGMDLSCAPD